MFCPSISVIIPAYNEAQRLPKTLDKIIPFMDDFRMPYEIIIVENGSTDNTLDIAHSYQAGCSTLFVIQSEPGKGQAIKTGMLFASGRWRYMCDADLSTPIQQLPLFCSMMAQAPVVIGSREAQGSRRIDEPQKRHIMGRAFNRVIQQLLIPGVSDSQCGFKMFRAEVVPALFGQQTINGWAFDVEILYLARRYGYRIVELGIPWEFDADSRIRPGRDALKMAWDVLRIKMRAINGGYDSKKAAELAPVRFTH